MKQYEAMFLFDPTFGSSFENCEAEVRRLMDRAEAELLFCKKWDERRLAYKIKGRKRGVYVLVYFKAASDKIAPLERDVRIAENILRVLVVRADGVTREMMELAVKAQGAMMSGDDDSSYHRRPPRRDAGSPGKPAAPAVSAPDTPSAPETAPTPQADGGATVATVATGATGSSEQSDAESPSSGDA